ncbi:hypothetical protein [Jeotgalibacillus aurantiacus]|uniref:hypothetical protein n=1 Tax=Jeotgalibacillus aurantiacus TaxID=2763266 RepID=UPI001D0ADA8B|nr:hypothetical protein [Jeotgalibacillus aurantiacus]
MGKLKKVEISAEVTEFYRRQTAGLSRDEVERFIEQAQAGEIDFSDNRRIKRCQHCDYYFEDSRANKRKCCSDVCKNRYDTARRRDKRQQATADRQGLTVEQLHEKRARDGAVEIPIGDAVKLDYLIYADGTGNRRKNTSEVDESGAGKSSVYVTYGQREVDREPSNIYLQKSSREEIDAYLTEKYGDHRLRMESNRAKSYGKHIHF